MLLWCLLWGCVLLSTLSLSPFFYFLPFSSFLIINIQRSTLFLPFINYFTFYLSSFLSLSLPHIQLFYHLLLVYLLSIFISFFSSFSFIHIILYPPFPFLHFISPFLRIFIHSFLFFSHIFLFYPFSFIYRISFHIIHHIPLISLIPSSTYSSIFYSSPRIVFIIHDLHLDTV